MFDTKISLLYPAVPDLMFRFMSLGKHVNTESYTVIDLAQCLTESVLIAFDVFPNVCSVIHDVLEVIQKGFLCSECTRCIAYDT